MTKSTKVAVLGSINMDLVIRCSHLPARGETVMARDASEVCGGKGANQAVQGALAGGHVSMIGKVGNDAFADRLLKNLQDHGVDTQFVTRCENGGSGIAMVAVEDSGENAILVSPGANGSVSVADVEEAAAVITGADVLLVQLEIPLSAVLRGMELARSANVPIVLDPAPAPQEFPKALLQVDFICPNTSEASLILGRSVSDDVPDAEKAACELKRLGARHAAITMGAAGALLLTDNGAELAPAFPIQAVDTTAAGDAFAGALAVLWGEGMTLTEAVRFANAAGAISASRAGAQPSMGSRDEIFELARR